MEQTNPLPDFLRLSSEQVDAEKKRQEQLRTMFNSRVRLTPAQSEFWRGQMIEGVVEGERLAEAVAAQGRFLEASEIAEKEAKEFYQKAAEAVHDNTPCLCPAPTSSVQGRMLKLPKYRVIKGIYSLQQGSFGWLVECNTCHLWTFSGSNPNPEREPKSDLELLKV